MGSTLSHYYDCLEDKIYDDRLSKLEQTKSDFLLTRFTEIRFMIQQLDNELESGNLKRIVQHTDTLKKLADQLP